MLFNYTHEAVLKGLQTQSLRRLAPGEVFDPVRRVLYGPDRKPKAFVGRAEPIELDIKGQVYSLGSLRILNMRQIRLRDLRDADAKALGCRDLNDLVALWMLTEGAFHRDQQALLYEFKVIEAYHEARPSLSLEAAV
jgi:hypothetical protein